MRVPTREGARVRAKGSSHRSFEVHTPLSSVHEGGRLLLLGADRGEVREARATPGVGTAIDNAVVHGVSRVTAGVRHVLLAAFD